MADSSTTTTPILDLMAGGCWARRQLRNGIRYFPAASKLRKSVSSVEGVLGISGDILHDGRLLHNCMTDFDSVYWWLLSLTLAF